MIRGKLPANIVGDLRSSRTLDEFCQRVYRQSSKMLRKHTAEVIETPTCGTERSVLVALDDIALIKCVAGLVTNDDLQTILRRRLSEQHPSFFPVSPPHTGPFMNTLDAKYVRSLLMRYRRERIMLLMEQRPQLHLFTDTIMMWRKYRSHERMEVPERPRNWQELHDQIARTTRNLHLVDFEIAVPSFLKEIHGKEFKGLQFEAPTSHHQMLNWGEEFRNCVGSYADDVHAGRRAVLAVRKAGKLTYCIEINRGTIVQFYGVANQLVTDHDDYASVVASLHAAGGIGCSVPFAGVRRFVEQAQQLLGGEPVLAEAGCNDLAEFGPCSFFARGT